VSLVWQDLDSLAFAPAWTPHRILTPSSLGPAARSTNPTRQGV
jgi:hypothetical protein